MVAFRAVHCGDLAEAWALVDRARAVLGSPLADTFADLAPDQLGLIGLDPVVPLGARSRSEPHGLGHVRQVGAYAARRNLFRYARPLV